MAGGLASGWLHVANKLTYQYCSHHRRILEGNAMHRKFETNIPRNETARPRSQTLHPCICEGFILVYFQDRSAYFAVPIVGIYKSLTDTRMLKLGTRPRSFISGNICLEFLVQCICSVDWGSLISLLRWEGQKRALNFGRRLTEL